MLVNQRLMMNFKLALSSLFLGILTLFMMWALQWALESRKVITLGMPGEVTELQVWYDPRVAVATDAATVQEELKAYLRDRSLALIISSIGDSYPEMIVHDPHGLLPWFPQATLDDLHSQANGVYLFKGTYSERRWSKSTTPPLLPEGAVVERAILAPSGAGSLQWARRLGQDPPVPTLYRIHINTSDPIQVRHILDLLSRMGLTEQKTLKIPLLEYLIFDPLFAITTFFLVLGHTCTVLYWSLYLRERAHEFNVRRCHGARTSGLVRENLAGGLPGLAAGGVAGVILSGLLVMSIGHVPLTPESLRTLAGAGISSVIFVIATWSMTLYTVLTFGRARR